MFTDQQKNSLKKINELFLLTIQIVFGKLNFQKYDSF